MPPSPPTKRVRFQFPVIQEDTTRMDCGSPRREPTSSTRTIQLNLLDSCTPPPGRSLPLKRMMHPIDNDDDDRQPCWNPPPALKNKKSAFTLPMLLVPPPPSRRTNYQQQEQRAIMDSWPTAIRKRTALVDIENCTTNGTTISNTLSTQPPRKKPRLLLRNSTLDKKHWNLQGIISRMMS